MKKAGIPILPGSDGPVESEERAAKIARDLGTRSSSKQWPAAADAACG